MTSAQWKAIAVLVGVFAFGSVTGVAGSLVYLRRQGMDVRRFEALPRGNRPLLALYRKLNLTDAQRDAIAGILERRAPERQRLMREVMQTCGQSVREEKAALDAEIRAVLTPAQRQKFDELARRQGDRLFPPLEEGDGEGRRRGGPGRAMHGRDGDDAP